jgi:large subunit ribosomal protein L10e
MALTRARAIRTIDGPYTRKSKVKSKGYVKTIPPKHVVRFTMGASAKYFRNEFAYIIRLVSKDAFQIRDNAIEASRTHILRELELAVGKDFYFLIAVYPHHIIREHKQASVAQADRISTGMQRAFGNPTSLAVQLKPGKEIFLIAVNDETAIPKIRVVLEKIKPKLSCRTRIDVEKVKNFKKSAAEEGEAQEYKIATVAIAAEPEVKVAAAPVAMKAPAAKPAK